MKNSINSFKMRFRLSLTYLDLEYGVIANHGGPVTLGDEQDVVALEETDEAHDAKGALTHHQPLTHHLADLRKLCL